MAENRDHRSGIHLLGSSNGGPELLIDLIENAGVGLESSCAGNGTCGKCRVRIISGKCLPPGKEELEFLSARDLDSSIRLACYCQVQGEVTIAAEIHDGDHRILEQGKLADLDVEAEISKLFLPEMPCYQKASLLEDILQQLGIDHPIPGSIDALRFLSSGSGNEATAIMAQERLIGLEDGDTTGEAYGVAVDIGTTTVVASLHRLNDGCELAVASALNPQTQHGLDVLSRVQYAARDLNHLTRLSHLIIDCLNELIADLCRQSGIDKRYIYIIAAAGNTVMLHLLLEVNPTSLGRAPYRPVFRAGQLLAAKQLGFTISPFGILYCLPSVSGFVGADIVAGIIASQLDEEEDIVLFLDLGTNGEMVLGKEGRLMACSTAAGPALEGMNIECGMLAARGAVEDVWVQDKALRWKTIDQVPPLGLCGSGLLDMVASMLKCALINSSGRITDRQRIEELYPLLPLAAQIDEIDGKRRYWLVPPAAGSCPNGIYISQADIRQVQLAKSAIITGINALLTENGLDAEQVQKVYLAGAFGAYLKSDTLIRLGFFPEIWRDRIAFAGNTSRSGAVMALLSRSVRSRMEQTAGRVAYIELESCPGFEREFVKNMGFPETGKVLTANERRCGLSI